MSETRRFAAAGVMQNHAGHARLGIIVVDAESLDHARSQMALFLIDGAKLDASYGQPNYRLADVEAVEITDPPALKQQACGEPKPAVRPYMIVHAIPRGYKPPSFLMRFFCHLVGHHCLQLHIEPPLNGEAACYLKCDTCGAVI